MEKVPHTSMGVEGNKEEKQTHSYTEKRMWKLTESKEHSGKMDNLEIAGEGSHNFGILLTVKGRIQ